MVALVLGVGTPEIGLIFLILIALVGVWLVWALLRRR